MRSQTKERIFMGKAAKCGGRYLEHSAINSSLILSAGYDETSKTLELTFGGGVTYRYSDVPQQVYEALLEADSKGSYYHSKIRGVYPSEKLT